jgi:hypothetical protein
MRTFLLFFLFLASPSLSANRNLHVPEGFVLQHLDATDGQIVRPKDWFFSSSGTESGWLWVISKEDSANGPYETGLRIELQVGVQKRYGQTREALVDSFLAEKRAGSTQIVKDCEVSDIDGFHRRCLEVIESIQQPSGLNTFHILYSVMWGKDLDMIVVSTFGAPRDAWPSVTSTADAMREFVLIGPNFGKAK